ncbi:MAG: hypothetical protein EBU90_13045 [Proteobacteria bacterium]|nr:hypothetical protein [Pseudomonadota bacterium]NBP15489.1 hypothetical protein [bacterium]
MIFKKILYFLDKSEQSLPKYGNLYKLKNEPLPFRYIFVYGDDKKGIHRFKHHQLKEYVFYDFSQVEREANLEEVRIYNIVKDYINELARKENNSYHN